MICLIVWTIGHSTLTAAEFVEHLTENCIQVIADVRRFPGSRKYPQFNQDELKEVLGAAGIQYLYFPELGGRRRPQAGSRNTAWRNPSFQGYADYMETEAFGSGIGRLLETARKCRTALLCSEAVWWRCHRSMIADRLKAGGIEVLHIVGDAAPKPHPYTSVARVRNGKLTYAVQNEPKSPSE